MNTFRKLGFLFQRLKKCKARTDAHYEYVTYDDIINKHGVYFLYLIRVSRHFDSDFFSLNGKVCLEEPELKPHDVFVECLSYHNYLISRNLVCTLGDGVTKKILRKV